MSTSKGPTHLVAGAASGFCSCIVGQPLDLLKTRLQQQEHLQVSTTSRQHSSLVFSRHETQSLVEIVKRIVSEESIFGLWRGTFPTILRTVPGSAVYFFTLNELRTFAGTRKGHYLNTTSVSALPKLSNNENLITGATARAAVGFLFMPITVLKVRVESSLYNYNHGLYDATKSLYKTDGLRGFFYGYGATALRDAPYAGIYVLFYEKAKLSLHTTFSSVAVPALNSIAGAFAATAATLTTHPFDLLKTRMQVNPKEYPNTLKALYKIFSQEGFIGLYDGFILRVARKAITSAVAWTIYEHILLSFKE